MAVVALLKGKPDAVFEKSQKKWSFLVSADLGAVLCNADVCPLSLHILGSWLAVLVVRRVRGFGILGTVVD